MITRISPALLLALVAAMATPLHAGDSQAAIADVVRSLGYGGAIHHFNPLRKTPSATSGSFRWRIRNCRQKEVPGK